MTKKRIVKGAALPAALRTADNIVGRLTASASAELAAAYGGLPEEAPRVRSKPRRRPGGARALGRRAAAEQAEAASWARKAQEAQEERTRLRGLLRALKERREGAARNQIPGINREMGDVVRRLRELDGGPKAQDGRAYKAPAMFDPAALMAAVAK